MGFFSNLFNTKKIVSVEIIGYTEGISEDDALSNYAAGHMMGGFDGMVHASLLNESEAATTTFLIHYDNGTSETRTVKDGSSQYNYYIRFVR